MKISCRSRLSKALCLLVMTCLLCRPSFGDAPSSKTTDQLLTTLQARLAAAPATKAFSANFAEKVGLAVSQGDYLEIERSLMQIKVRLSSDPEAVAVVEMLLAQFKVAEAAETSVRDGEVDSVTKELVAKFDGHAPASDYDGLLRKITGLVNSFGASYGDPRDAFAVQHLEDARTFTAGWQQYLVDVQANPQQGAAELNQLIQLTSRFTAIPRSTLLNLQNSAASDAGAAAHAAAEKAKVDAYSAKLIAKIDAAKVPSDLDAALADEGPGGRNGAQPYQGYSTKDFIRKWQDFLLAANAGRHLEAQKILKELAANSQSTLYPRSKILARMEEEGKTAGIRTSGGGLLMDPAALTLDNLPTLIAQIDALGDPAYLYEHGEASLKGSVERLIHDVNQVKAGDSRTGVLAGQNVMMYSTGQLGEYSDALQRLSEQIVISALPGYCGIPADMKPLPRERLPSYFDRAIQSAMAAKDWHLAFRIAEARRDMPLDGNPNEVMADYLCLRSLVIAMDKDDATLWAQAVADYSDALGSTSRLVPTKEIAARLERIRRQHPDEYAKGQALPDYPALIQRLSDMQHSPMSAPRLQGPGGHPANGIQQNPYSPGFGPPVTPAAAGK
jgi:hypothetical protein